MSEEIKVSDEARELAKTVLRLELQSQQDGRNLSHPLWTAELEKCIQSLLTQRDEEIAELRRDKARLDWGQKNFMRVALGTPQTPNDKWTIFGWSDDGSDDVEGDSLRDALDAAMSKDAKGGV